MSEKSNMTTENHKPDSSSLTLPDYSCSLTLPAASLGLQALAYLADDQLRSHFTRFGGAPFGAFTKRNQNRKKHTLKKTRPKKKQALDNIKKNTHKKTKLS